MRILLPVNQRSDIEGISTFTVTYLSTNGNQPKNGMITALVQPGEEIVHSALLIRDNDVLQSSE